MATMKETLEAAMLIEGALAVALVDSSTGMALGSAGNRFNAEVAAAGNTDVVRSKMKVMQALGISDTIEDILITLREQYHLIRLVPGKNLFLYMVFLRSGTNLGMARYRLNELAEALSI